MTETNNKKDKFLNFVVTPKIHAILKEEAKRDGRTTGGLVRDVIVKNWLIEKGLATKEDFE